LFVDAAAQTKSGKKQCLGPLSSPQNTYVCMHIRMYVYTHIHTLQAAGNAWAPSPAPSHISKPQTRVKSRKSWRRRRRRRRNARRAGAFCTRVCHGRRGGYASGILRLIFFSRIIFIFFKARGGYASGTLRLRYLFLFLFTSTIGTLRL